MEDHLKKDVAEYFSNRSDYWESIYDADKNASNLVFQFTGRKDEILKRIDEFAESQPLKILDIGCGPGVILKELLQKGHHVCGIDISEKMAATAKTNLGKACSNNTGCLQGDAESLPFINDHFDVIICAGVLSYLEVDHKGIKEISRVLKHDGILLLTLPNIFRLNNVLDPYYYLNKGVKFIAYKLSRDFVKEDFRGDFEANNSFHIRKYFYNQLNNLLELSGLRVKETISLGYGPLTFWRKEILPLNWSFKLSLFFESLVKIRLFKFLSIFANHWVVYLEKRSKDNTTDIEWGPGD